MKNVSLKSVVLILFVGLLPSIIAQSGDGRQPSLSDPRTAQIDTLLNSKKWEESLPLLSEALTESKERAQWDKYADSALKLARAMGELTRTDSSCILLEQVLAELGRVGQDTTLQAASLYNYLAVNHGGRSGRFQKSLEAYQNAIAIFERLNTLGQRPAYAYKNAAQIFVRFENYSLAQHYFEASIRVDTGGYYRAANYAQLANQHHFWGDEQAVMRYYLLGMRELKKSESVVAHLYASGASAFIALSKNEEAKEMLLKALEFYQQDATYWVDNLIRSLTTLADVAARQHQPSQAEAYYRQAEAEGKKSYILKNGEPFKSREMAKLYIEWGRFLEKQQQPDRALICYQQALVQAFPQFNSGNITDNPSLDDAWLESQAMEAALAKGMLMADLSLSQRNEKKVETGINAAHCFDLAFIVAARLRHTYGNDADKLALAANLRQALNAAVLNLRSLHAADHSPAHIYDLFELLEQTRATALSDALRQQRALALTGIPDTLLVREESLRREAAALENDLKRNELKRDSAGMTRLQPVSFKASMAHSELLLRLQKQYPQFSQYTQADQAAEIKTIAQALPDTAALMSWHDAGDRFLCVMLQRGNLTLHEVPRDSILDHTLARFVALLSDKTGQEQDAAAFFRAAHFLGQQLLPPEVLSTAKSLIIIPDGSLCRLPFEVLLTQAHPSGGFGNAPYLLRSHTVQYAWSATLLTQPVLGASATNGLLQLAPFATSTRDGLAQLSNSLRDTPKDLGADVLQGAAATTDVFLKKAPEYAALHLSTHASAGGRAIPGIEFADRTLALPEIYAQRFHASLVSLSACETATGSFAQSEGVLSLARAFAYAGAQSLVASLWSVNDRSTADLFTAFYDHLSQGMSKAEALRQAKLQYLTSSEMDVRKAPFHWAAFTMTGMDGKVDLSGGRGWGWWVVLAAGLVGGGFFWWKRRRQQS